MESSSQLMQVSVEKTQITSETPASLSEQYRFLEEIGHGAQGRIFLATRLKDQTLVVIKQLNVDSVANWKAYDLFRREADVLASLQIPGVAKFYDAFECLDDDPPCSYIVQEYIRGSALAELLKRGHRFSRDDVYDILIQMLKILQHLQSRVPPVIHRDIKPSNIMLKPLNGDNYQVYLIDFGAVANPQVQGGGSTVAGTFGYMPPEQLMGNPCPASDIYSLAAVAVELFSGKSPATLPNRDFRLIFEPEVEHLPVEVVATLRQMLEPKVENRFQNAEELIETFKSFKAHQFQIKSTYTDTSAINISDYNDKLKEVKNIGAPGNIELWQSLADEVPRNIPEAYREIHEDHKVIVYHQQNTQVISRGGLLFLMSCTIFIVILVLALVVTNTPFPLFIKSTIFIVGILWCFFCLFKNVSKEEEHHPHVIKNDVLPPCAQELQELMTYGRKTIATIIKIDYQPAYEDDVIFREKEDNKPLEKNIAFSQLCALPKFKITYRFNPPDDARSEDLIHHFFTYVEPEGHYKEGDPLPILYSIGQNYYGEIIHSMPFPIPLEDACLPELIDHSMPVDATKKMKEILDACRKNYWVTGNVAFKNLNNPDVIERGDFYVFYPSSSNSCAQILIPLFCYFLTQEKFTSIHRKCTQFIQENISYLSWIDKEQSVNNNSDINDSPNELFKAVCQCICHPKVNRDYQMDILLAIARNQFSHPFLMERPIDCLFYNTFCTFVKQSHVSLADYSVLIQLLDLDFKKALLMNEDMLSQHRCLMKRFIFESSLPTEYSLENQTATQYNSHHKMNYKFLLEYIQKYKGSEKLVSFGVLDELLPLNSSRMLPDFYYETMHKMYMDPETNDQVKAWIKRMINHGQYTPYQYAIQ